MGSVSANPSRAGVAALFFQGSESYVGGVSRRKKPDIDALSDENLVVITKWLGTCSQTHIECQLEDDTRLPTRVIDVGPADATQAPRLLVTSGESGRYVALSHCWGSLMQSDAGQHARTLTTNLENMQRGISLENLPRTFQDAVLVVRKLGLRFLWIDALCIVQDDLADWAREAARMADVYGSAHLTIAATSAESSTDGFLKRPPLRAASIPYYVDTCTEPAGYLVVTYEPKEDSWYSSIEMARWNTRGWTFQERLLSKRVLHFTARRLFWECRMTDASEENEPPRGSAYRTSWLKDTVPDGPSSSTTDRNTRPPTPRFDIWYSIVSR